jgi:hypothetical protein
MFVLLVQNLILVRGHVLNAEKFIGNEFSSWQFLKSLTDRVLVDQESLIGYFPYTPDVYAYGPKYAIHYQQKKHPSRSILPFAKSNITFITYEPPPISRVDMSIEFWAEQELGIVSQPLYSVSFPNGYIIEKYYLTASESASPINPDLDMGVIFR